MAGFALVEYNQDGTLTNVGEIHRPVEPLPGDLLIHNDLDDDLTYFRVITRVFTIGDQNGGGDLIVHRLSNGEGRREHYAARLKALDL